MKDIKILKGNIIFTKNIKSFEVHEKSYIVIEKNKVVGIFKQLPEIYNDNKVKDYNDALIIPSFVDLHIHAPQYLQMGIGLNLELIDWLNQYTFKNEELFSDVNHAKRVYPNFVEELYQNGTLRSCIYGTIHNNSNQILVEELSKKKLSAYVGKVNMDQNAPSSLIQTTEDSIRETKEFIEANNNNDLIKPIITPRFALSCTSDLLKQLGNLSIEKKIPVQTHLAETKNEVKWVKQLFPDCESYSHVYKKHKLYSNIKTIMAHAIHLTKVEINLAKHENVYLVHCPNSNMNLASGLMPVTKYLDKGINVGLGSDVGAGHKIGMQDTIASAIQCSKIRHAINPSDRILKECEAFYLGTKLNGSFFGKTGSFEQDYLFDALVIKDEHPLVGSLKPLERLQRFIYCGNSNSIIARYLEGQLI